MDTPTFVVEIDGQRRETKSPTEAAKWIAQAEVGGLRVEYDVAALTRVVREQRIQRLRARVEEEKKWIARAKEADELARKDAPTLPRANSEISNLERKDEQLWRRLDEESQDL